MRPRIEVFLLICAVFALVLALLAHRYRRQPSSSRLVPFVVVVSRDGGLP